MTYPKLVSRRYSGTADGLQASQARFTAVEVGEEDIWGQLGQDVKHGGYDQQEHKMFMPSKAASLSPLQPLMGCICTPMRARAVLQIQTLQDGPCMMLTGKRCL